MSWLSGTFASLEVRSYRVLWLGTLLSFLAFFMSTVVQSVVAFELEGTNRAVGIVIFGQGIAMVVLGPLGGALADRWPKRPVIAVGQAISGLVFGVLAVLVATGSIHVIALAVGSLVTGASIAFLGPARQAYVVEVVPAELRGNAMAVSQIANNASRVAGPAVAGGLLAWSVAGATGAYSVMAGLYAFSILTLLFLPSSPGRADRDTHVLADVLDGLRYVNRRRRLRILVVLFVLVITTGFPYVTILPGLVENEFGRGAEAISALHAVSAVGGLAASLWVARFADSALAAAIFTGMGLGFGASLCALAVAPSFEASIALMTILGFASGGFQALSAAVIIRETEVEYVGRVMSLTLLAFGAFGLMALPIGLLADAIGERGTAGTMGVVVLGIVVVCRAVLARVERAHAGRG